MGCRYTSSMRCAVAVFCCLAWIIQCSECLTPGKVCSGTNDGMSHTEDSSSQLLRYIDRYENCTYVDGNLEITWLEHGSYNLSFLSSIQEVSGYVLIAYIYNVDAIPLTNLRIIRGHTLFSVPGDPTNHGYSLYVSHNYLRTGVRELQLTSLHEIMAGSILFEGNYDLCFVDTILWPDVVTHRRSNFSVPSKPVAKCGMCDPACDTDGERRCWGSGPQMCQKLIRNCSPQCESSCYGPRIADCCHPECVGGCTGPTNTECWACRNFILNGMCIPHCPKPTIYNPQTRRNEPNPDVKYAYGTTCVGSCPSHTLMDEGACVSDCGENKFAVDGKCVPCSGPCPKECDAPSSPNYIHGANINNYTGCTVIRGTVRILQFINDSVHTPLARFEQFSAFESVQEITEALVVERHGPDFTNLSFFRNLRIIHGRDTDRYDGSLLILHTSLRSLGLRSLTTVLNGRVLMGRNAHLCFANTINWRQITNNRRNAFTLLDDYTNCASCSRFCDSSGCWGPGADQCVSCMNYSRGGECVAECDVASGFYKNASTKECLPCSDECLNTCIGPGTDECDSCRNFQDGSYCVAQCPESTYPDAERHCQLCSANCQGGCTGPNDGIGDSACRSCDVVVYDPTGPFCLSLYSKCPEDFYTRYVRDNRTHERYTECHPCHHECRGCEGPSAGLCIACAHYKQRDRCVESCFSDYYVDGATKQCIECDRQCLECHGPTAADCISCRFMKLYLNLEERSPDSPFNCTDVCPDWAPAELLEREPETTKVCVTDAIYSEVIGSHMNVGAIVGGVLVALIVVGIVIVVVVFLRRQWARSEETKARINARLAGEDEILPLDPSSARPDMAQMRIVTESELQRGAAIGSGAFGTVYKGVWVPPNENVKLPVAIKVLNEGSSSKESRELLDEARIMASVDHPYCLRVVAVCLAPRLMLVVPLMPLGSLLDYLHKNVANVDSKRMLNWATQIARGMEYLEGRGIVHRDLAARNVLVQNANVVKITDFGLAKLLDPKEEFKATGGKMPIKWLAIESIRHQIFTHKSDVWSYGITLWELFTYGQRPYEEVRAVDVPAFLENGTRLTQPPICTIDVYMIMIKCWMVDPDCRPQFAELGDIFTKWARDPGRYLVIDGDKQMKMPLHHDYNAKELIADVGGNAEGPEAALTVDEYLMPQKWVDEEKTDEVPGAAGKKKKKQGDKKFGGLESGRADPGRRVSSTRYTSAPCKDDPKSNYAPMKSGKGAAAEADKNVDELQMPVVAENDYLLPQSGAAAAAPYMDIVPDSDSRAPRTATNPEYFADDKSSSKPPRNAYYNNSPAGGVSRTGSRYNESRV